MRTRRGPGALVALVLAMMLIASACGDSGSDTTAATAAPEPTATTAAAVTFDLVGAVDGYLAGIPEGYMAMGDITAFKDAVGVGAMLIDVREVAEYEEGHLAGAVNIPLRTLAENLDKIPTDRQVFIYCASGYRAAVATSALRILGYDNVLSFPPSYKGWTAAGEAVTTDMPAVSTYAIPTIQPELYSAVAGFLSGIPEGFLSAGNVEKVKAAMDSGAFMLDVRTAGEFAEGHIPGAVNITLRELGAGLEDIPKDALVIAYCKSGHRAAVAMAALQVLGYENVRAFPASWMGWTEAGEPIET